MLLGWPLGCHNGTHSGGTGGGCHKGTRVGATREPSGCHKGTRGAGGRSLRETLVVTTLAPKKVTRKRGLFVATGLQEWHSGMSRESIS